MIDIEPSEDEVLRLTSAATGTRLRFARWENIWADYLAGKPFEATAAHYGLHPNTIKRLLKYYIARQICKGEMKWPIDSLGRMLCDIPHPQPRWCRTQHVEGCPRLVLDKDPAKWCHVRARLVKGSKTEAWCPVCQRRGELGLPVKPKTLCEVFGSSQHEDNQLVKL